MNIPKIVIPVIVVIALFSVHFLRSVFTQPTTSAVYQDIEGAKLVCKVEGLKCKGTANFFNGLFYSVPGIIAIDTYATEHEAVFTYAPKMISPAEIREIMEQRVILRDGSSRQVFKCISMK